MRRGRAAALLALLALACGERDQPAGVIEGARRAPLEDPAARGPDPARTILFGDLHVHTTYSVDAFIYSLPLFGGEGAHPPADACDYARYCSALDFFSITDHAEGLTPEKWRRIVDSTRQCNARAGNPADPDLVAFIGWEWTQAGPTPEEHYGHKNVIFPGLADDEIPARPINSLPFGTTGRAPPGWVLGAAAGLLGAFGQDPYADFLWSIRQMAETPECAQGLDTRELPRDCQENAPTPALLFEKLRQWGFETLVIPHGLAWGIHAPPGSRLDVQLDPANHDPERQRLLEVASGHGNSEEYRAWRAVETGPDGEPVCPEPTEDYLPCCWRAGEIVRERCGDLPHEECEERVREARRLALEAGVKPQRVLPDTRPEDWLDCGQCRDCFKPAYALRPRQSAQYALALGDFDATDSDGRPLRYRLGFIASSDDHKAQAGTGYKQILRKKNTDARGLVSQSLDERLRPFVRGEQEDPRRAQPAPQPRERGFRDLFDAERVASFMYPGGLVAVHAEGRDRGSIWQALRRREVYGTSGPRILLWFDLLDAPGGRRPMGSEVELDAAPRFEVRAVGSPVQLPGCPAWSVEGLSTERLERLCRGECNNPGDARHAIAAIEVVRIRPQQSPGEDVTALIEDPWRRFDCPPDPAGCRITFSDEEFAGSGRDAVYYVRALQEETPAINGANLRTRFDESGQPLDVDLCYGGYQTSDTDDCLAPVQERAWSSPIFVDQARRGARS
jgi:hypothetical protein